MDKRRILINAVSSSIQVLVIGVVYFFLYKYLLKSIGSIKLGIWSLVLATTSIGNLAKFGITSGLVKFVAEYKAKKRYDALTVLISTALWSIIFFFTVLILLVYFLSLIILSKVIDQTHIDIARRILPYSLLSLFINEVGAVFSSVIEGFQRNYIRNIIYSLGILLMYFFTLLLTPSYGLVGVAYAQIIQGFFIFILSLWYSQKFHKINLSKYFFWSKTVFKEIFSYGLKFQAISIFQMLYEPTTKALLSLFGGLSLVAYYEMASRLVTQIRSLIVNANQVMIPVYTEASIIDESKIKKAYLINFELTYYSSIYLTLFVSILIPIISIFWIGHYEFTFVIFSLILLIANLFNMLCGPAYFGFLAKAVLNPLVKIHFFISILNLFLAYIFGYFFFGYGVVLGWAVSLSLPSIILIYLYDKYNNFSIKSIILSNQFLIIAVFCIYFLLFVFYRNKMWIENNFMEFTICSIFIILIIILTTPKNIVFYLIKKIK